MNNTNTKEEPNKLEGLDHIKDLIHEFMKGTQRFPGLIREFAFSEVSYDKFEENLQKKDWDLILCSCCTHAQVLFDVIMPSDSVEWSAVRTTIRCAKSAEKFIIGYTKIFGKVPTPGLYTYRTYPCPSFEEYVKK